jgi:GDSL-like Lipase/Acylhydrolase family
VTPVGSGRPRARWVAAALLLCVVAGACGQNPGAFARVHAPTGPATVFVALGGDESAGSQVSDGQYQDWIQLFYREALSARSTLYDFSSEDGTTVEELLGGELSEALAVHPDLVTVWIGLEDLLQGTPVSVFGSELSQVLVQLKAIRARVLVAELLPLNRFPDYDHCSTQPLKCELYSTFDFPPPAQMAAEIAGYDQAIEAAARANGDTVVGISGAFSARLAAAGSPALADSSDLGLTPAGESLVAQTFAGALGNVDR